MIKVPLILDLTLDNEYGYCNSLTFEIEALLKFFDTNAIIQKYFTIIDRYWKEYDRPFLILKGTENSNVGSYIVYCDVETEYTSFSFTLYYCSDLNNLSSSNLTEVGPLLTFYNPNLRTAEENYRWQGNSQLNIIPMSVNQTILLFGFNDSYMCSMIAICKNQNVYSYQIIINGSKTGNSSWIQDYTIGTDGINLVSAVESFSTAHGRNYYRQTLGAVEPVPALQRMNLDNKETRKVFPLVVGDQIFFDIWCCDGKQPFSIFLRKCKIDDIEYFTLWKNILIKDNNADIIISGDTSLVKRNFEEQPLEVFLYKTELQSGANGVHFIFKNESAEQNININVYKNNIKVKTWNLNHRGIVLPTITVNDTIELNNITCLVGDNSHVLKGTYQDKILLTYTVNSIENLSLQYLNITYVNNAFRNINIKNENGANQIIAKGQCSTDAWTRDIKIKSQGYLFKNNNDTAYYSSAFIENSFYHSILMIGSTEDSVKTTAILKDENENSVEEIRLQGYYNHQYDYCSIKKEEQQIFKVVYNAKTYYCNFVIFNILIDMSCRYHENTINTDYGYAGQAHTEERVGNSSFVYGEDVKLYRNLFYRQTWDNNGYYLPEVTPTVNQSTTFSTDDYFAKYPMMWIYTNGTPVDMSDYFMNKENCYFSPEAVISLINNIEEWEETEGD